MLLHRALSATALGLVAAAGLAPSAYAAPVTCDGKVATIVGTTGPDRIVGTPGRDVIAGLAGNDKIDGRGGNDVICGGPGGDKITGGPGNDRLLSGPPAPGNPGDPRFTDALDGGPGNDTLVARGRPAGSFPVAVSYAGAPRGVTVDLAAGTATGWGDDTILADAGLDLRGSGHDDTLVGGPYDDWIDGRGGDDTISGGPGRDQIVDGSGDDTLSGGPGDDDLMIFRGRDTAHGDGGDDQIYADDWKPDVITGDAGDDWIHAMVPISADQSITGGSGTNRATLFFRRVVAGTVVFTRVTTDMTAGTAGYPDEGVSFPLAGMARLDVEVFGTWTAVGTSGNDAYHARWGTRLVATMGEGNDRVTGANKADTLDGGPGTDTVRPGGGHDVCSAFEKFPDQPCEESS